MPRKFYGFDFYNGAGNCLTVGIVTSYHGIHPSWTESEDGKVLVVGHDCSISFVDVAARRVSAVRRLDGAFCQFIPAGRGRLIVLHELGAVEFDFSANQLWSVSTYIVEDWRMPNGETLVLQDEEGELTVDLATRVSIRSPKPNS